MSGNNIVVRRDWSELEGTAAVQPVSIPALRFFQHPVFAHRGQHGHVVEANRWHDDALRLSGRGYAFHSFAGAVVFTDLDIVEEVDQLRLEQARLAQEIAELKGEVRVLKQQVEPPALRDLTDEAAKSEIKAFFASRHGEEIYASDVAAALLLDYDKVAHWLQELENDGQITVPTEQAGADDTDARTG